MLARDGVVPNLAGSIPIGEPVHVPMLTAQIQQSLQSWQGPYPPPEAVERYEKILPGTFDRMIGMAERLQEAQIAEANRSQNFLHADQKRGHYLGAATTILAMVGALIAVYLRSELVAGLFLSVPVMAVAKAFIDSARGRPGQSTPLETSPRAEPPPIQPSQTG
jgi:uncharacterized membrane protein